MENTIGVDMYDKHITYVSQSDTKGIVVVVVEVVSSSSRSSSSLTIERCSSIII
jgi:hypothetical protein